MIRTKRIEDTNRPPCLSGFDKLKGEMQRLKTSYFNRKYRKKC